MRHAGNCTRYGTPDRETPTGHSDTDAGGAGVADDTDAGEEGVAGRTREGCGDDAVEGVAMDGAAVKGCATGGLFGDVGPYVPSTAGVCLSSRADEGAAAGGAAAGEEDA